jgi:hypothetical protein
MRAYIAFLDVTQHRRGEDEGISCVALVGNKTFDVPLSKIMLRGAFRMAVVWPFTDI